MSKVDALRALREARYARIAAAAPSKAPSKAPAKASPQKPVAPVAPRPAAPEPTVADATCGHRNMSGRACTREADHVKAGTKNHRYS